LFLFLQFQWSSRWFQPNVVSDWPWCNWPCQLFFPSRCYFRKRF
jgi:hypothetical protein